MRGVSIIVPFLRRHVVEGRDGRACVDSSSGDVLVVADADVLMKKRAAGS